MNNDIPTFTPPAPTFTPPEESDSNGRTCHYHQHTEAVAKCARCGKPVCQDCYENYRVAVGEYQGEVLCYDCCQEIVADNIKLLKKNRRSIVSTFIFTIIGIIIGVYVASNMIGHTFDAIGFLFFGGMIGGCFWTFVKNWIHRIRAAYDENDFWLSLFFGIFFGFIIEAVLSVYRTIRKIIECIIYLIKTSGFIKSDTNALAQMRDYLEYTIVMDRNAGVDLATLMNEGSELYNNSFAQSVIANGEESAENMLRNCVTTINENGEIIRSFSA